VLAGPRSAAENDPPRVFAVAAAAAVAAADNDVAARPDQTGAVRSLAHRSTDVDDVSGTDGR